ncbi:acyl-CoA dehydrogenase family protein [Streptomyces sp. NPDC057280]|uniref:acyl-CoA dehydrogenase family protein n=1 Tax=Streptomyces sp. NPDC057280 TaxID=3346081 RepID=UPI003639EFEC
MRLVLDAEQRAFTASLEALLTGADTPSVVREWSRGEHGSGRALWGRLAAAGVFALAAPEEYDGVGVRPVELALAFLALGRHVVPGPLVETVAAAVLLPAPDLVKRLVSGETLATVAYDGPYALDGAADLRPVPTPDGPYALDGDAADLRLVLTPDGLYAAAGRGPVRPSLDPARRLTTLAPGDLLTAEPPLAKALLLARLATAAQALGVGLALLDRTVAYVGQRTQFGTPVGSFQAVKHQLADVKTALEFARPLVLAAAVTLDPADVAAAKVTAGEAAYATARTALQLHGAIGYTAEYNLSLWLTKARALRTAWGSPQECRDTVLSAGGRRS